MQSETESTTVLIKCLDPLTGKAGWIMKDERYDFLQEIARSGFADMLHDSERNDKYYAAIKTVVEQTHHAGKKAHVLDIGTGTGLLAMMAARCGADTIYACEAFSPISNVAKQVIQENGLADRITVIDKRSTDMTVGEEGDMPCRANILVTEVFDTELIGEGAIATFNHAHKHLLEKDCLVVPSGGTVYAQIVESPWSQMWNHLSAWGDIKPSRAINECPGAAGVHDLQINQIRQEHFKAIAQPEIVFRFDWTGRTPIPEDDSSTVTTKAIADGSADVVFMWWSLDMDPQGTVVLSCAPWWAHPSRPPGPQALPWRDHWMQAVYYLHSSPIIVSKGQTLKLMSSHDEFSMWFNLTTDDRPDARLLARPVCECMLHVTSSRTRIGMLNDPTRRDKYMKVLKRLVTPESVVLSFGDTSLLGLMTATLGASKVYHVEEKPVSCEVMEGLVRDNNLKSKVTILKSATLDKKVRSSVNLVIGEPYFLNTLYPWDVLRWWSLKRQCPAAAHMPIAASLYAMPMQFDHLHKIQAPLGNINGFKMTAFDKLIQISSSITDSNVEVHPLWEYPGVSLSEPRKLISSTFVTGEKSYGNMPFSVSGTFHGVALWLDIHLDSDTTVSTGPQQPTTPGSQVEWDPYCRQGVYFLQSQVPVTSQNMLLYQAELSLVTGEINFSFKVQN